MTEGNTVVKAKRMGARLFKNPPQPHMCIRDSLKGCQEACYINVLSWDKVVSAFPGEILPLYGGMKVCPPRTENKEVSVFAVMANPGILQINGKNSRNPKEQSWLIEMLMDFVEKMNEGVIFNRSYTILRDRDITGELKEIWMVVQQSERPRMQQNPGGDDPRRPVPQYPLYREQQPQQHQQQQQQQHAMPQHHQHPPQQQQQQSVHNPHEDHPQQPPQYHSSVYYAQESPKNCESYEVTCARQNIASHVDRYIFRDPMVMQNHHTQIPQQQNCLNYPAIHQYRQMLGMPIGPYLPNIYPNVSINCPPPHPSNPMNLGRPDLSASYNKIPTDKFYDKYQPHPPPAAYYEPQNNQPTQNYRRILGPQESQDTVRRPPSHVTTQKSYIIVGNETRPVETINTPMPFVRVSDPSTGSLKLSVNGKLQRDQNPRKPSTINFLKLSKPNDAKTTKKDFTNPSEATNNTNDDTNFHDNDNSSISRNSSGSSKESKKINTKLKIKLLKRHISIGDDKTAVCDGKYLLNGETECIQETKVNDKTSVESTDIDNMGEKNISESERNENTDGTRNNETTRNTKTTTNISNSLKIITGAGNLVDDSAKKKNNSQAGLQCGKDNGDEVMQVYTILRKPETTASQENLTNDTAGLSIKECAENGGEVGAVVS